MRDTGCQAPHLTVIEGKADQYPDPKLDVLVIVSAGVQQSQCLAQQRRRVPVTPCVPGIFSRPVQFGRALPPL
ncbi:MAG TPA: hypothetical protein VG317_22575 [Pseudonocardiaceae bacterium]|nr:hypothetical protein [Pseudonocardiaceae bacterium]